MMRVSLITMLIASASEYTNDRVVIEYGHESKASCENFAKRSGDYVMIACTGSPRLA